MLRFFQKIILLQTTGINRVTPLSWQYGFASATIAETKNRNHISEDEKPLKPRSAAAGKDHQMVKAVFASIKLEDYSSEISTPSTDTKLFNAASVDELLSISEGVGVSRKHALKVVSVLSNWVSNSKVKFNEFENDPRFLKLCKILTRSPVANKYNTHMVDPSKNDDLSTVLSVTADEEAAKLVGSITLAQMIKVMTTLSVKRRRSTLLLRTLAFNIAGSSEKMDIKQCADLLYSISSLNFYDENLFEKAANDVMSVLEKGKLERSSVVGSILTSIGLLRYKNPTLLDAISEWVAVNHTSCRPQDIFSLFMTLAVLNFIPSNADYIFRTLIPQLTQQEAGKPLVWLEVVWSLVLLNQAKSEHIESVLNEEFINSLARHKSLTTSSILKLLNIDGAAHYLLKDYKGSYIDPDHQIRKTTLTMSKEKLQIVCSVIDSLKNLIPDSYFRSQVNTGLGFFIDAECVLDKTCNPLPLTHTGTEKIKVAILSYDYHDMSKGKVELTGVNEFSQRLLSAMGYRIVSIPYTEFKVTDKIVNKVQYLENKLKQAVKN